MNQKEIWIACGGTGGHFMPGVVLGRSLEQRGYVVRYWGEGKAIEENLAQAQKVTLQRPNPGSRWQRLKQLEICVWLICRRPTNQAKMLR